MQNPAALNGFLVIRPVQLLKDIQPVIDLLEKLLVLFGQLLLLVQKLFLGFFLFIGNAITSIIKKRLTAQRESKRTEEGASSFLIF